ncbi:MAG TPA: phenylalanine--tRNA ligase subunit beta, partial [Candidatus Saccharimonadales bacterium]|nr:phenylalanine--tRNA ligase subunit beta [Candidatus Saccharimonadales bacterium]
LAGIQGHSFKSPEWYRQDANVKNDGRSNGLKLRVENELPKLVPRFCAVAMKDVKLEPSPVWLRASLSRIGIKPINNLVDLSNFYMYLTAQPIHIYDYDKIKKLSGNSEARLLVRRAKQAEKTTVLGGKEISLSKEDMVVTVGKQIVCVGGIIGAVNSEVDDNTKNIIVEAASWDMNTIRKTAMSQGLFTDAATRFTRGQSPLQNMAVIGQIVSEIRAIAGGRVASQIVDENNVPPDAIKRGNLYPAVKVSVAFINSRLGLTLSRSQISKLLQTVEFKVESKADELTVTAPFWRIDVEIPEDIVEEVGRLYGYGHLPLDLPKRDLTPPKLDPLIAFKSSLRDILSSGGANEVLTYSFVNESLLKKANQDPKDAYHIRNAISPDLQYYRLSLTPSLLERIHPNIKLGFDKFVIFEIGKVHSKTEVEEGLPREFDRLALVLAKDVKETYNGSPFFSAKKYISYLFSEHDIQASYTPLDKVDSEAHKLTKHTVAVFEPLHSSGIYADGEFVGVLGEYKAEVSEALKLPAHSAGFELFISALQNPRVPNYEQLNRYPSLDQDICLRTDIKLSYATLESFINERLQAASHDDGYGYRLDPIDIFQKKNDENYKQTTWRITLWHPQKTLTTQEANNLLDKIAEDAAKKFKAERV